MTTEKSTIEAMLKTIVLMYDPRTDRVWYKPMPLIALLLKLRDEEREIFSQIERDCIYCTDLIEFRNLLAQMKHNFQFAVRVLAENVVSKTLMEYGAYCFNVNEEKTIGEEYYLEIITPEFYIENYLITDEDEVED